MNVSEVIAVLKKLEETHGDINVYMWPADISDMQLIDEIIFDDLFGKVICI